MLRFRMKMLSKENLMARTSDIGSCLGLLAGKILIVGFVVASAYGMEYMVTEEDQQFKGKTPYQLKTIAVAALNESAAVSLRLQEQLSKQSAPKTPVRIKKRRETLTDAVSNPQSGVLATPLRGMDTSSIVAEFKDVELTGDDANDFLSLCSVFEVYVQRKASSSVTTVARKDEERSSEPTDLNDILKLFKLRLAGIIGPDFLAFYTKEFDVLVVARKATVQQPAAPTLDLKKEGARYVGKIIDVVKSEGQLFNLVEQYRSSDEEDAEKHVMLYLMLGTNISDAATAFRPTQDATTLIEVGDQLRDKFFNTAQLTFIHYMSGQTNKTNVREIIAITNGGRGKAIPEDVLVSLNQELEQIFYPRRESGSLTVTRYEFERPRGGASGRQPLAIGTWKLPFVNAAVEVTGNLVSVFFGSCMVPQQHLLTNGDSRGSSSALAINDKDSDDL
ncbi:MAG: hypothetical protein WCJ92_02680 [Alphaproteobacteria bacterium]